MFFINKENRFDYVIYILGVVNSLRVGGSREAFLPCVRGLRGRAELTPFSLIFLLIFFLSLFLGVE